MAGLDAWVVFALLLLTAAISLFAFMIALEVYYARPRAEWRESCGDAIQEGYDEGKWPKP